MPNSANNRNVDIRNRKQSGQKLGGLGEMRRKLKKQVAKMNLPSRDDQMMAMADLVLAGGRGNCGELSAVAYKWLVTHGAHGVTFCGLSGGNHEFLIVGAPPPTRAATGNLSVGTPPTEFGQDAVWCDPWYGACFAVTSPEQWALGLRSIVHQTMPKSRGDLSQLISGLSIYIISYHA
jgi:hypothetical protein